jgi:DNA-binding NarL/FixJ family response regulator
VTVLYKTAQCYNKHRLLSGGRYIVMKRVMILSRQTVFWWGIKSLLQKKARCDIVAWETELDQALEQIHKLRPDVVLVEREDVHADNLGLIHRILNVRPKISVISLSLEENGFSLYRKERYVVDDVEDLIHAIEQAPAASVDESTTGYPADSYA